MKRRVRLTEGDLHRIVNESVRKTLKESYDEYGKLKACYDNYKSAEKELAAALRELLYKGDEDAKEALYNFIKTHATYDIERMLGIKNS